MDEAHNKLLERLRTYYGDDLACRTLLMDARHALEALAGEVERLKDRLRIANGVLAETSQKALELQTERDRMKAIGQKLLAKFDHPTAVVTQWDVDELRKTLKGAA